MENFNSIGAHWYNRKLNLKNSAQSVLSFLLLLKKHNEELFGVWYKKAYSKKAALSHKIDLSYQTIKDLIKINGVEDEYPETTFRVNLWNGATINGEAATISFALGGVETKSYSNNCVIGLPYKGSQYEKYRKPENQKELIKILKDFWQPEWLQTDSEKIC